MPSRDLFAGCLVGQAVGDALGFPLEGCDPQTCHAYFSSLQPGTSTLAVGQGRWAFGQYTDDTQLARELLQSWVECGRFDPTQYAHRIAAIFAEDRIVGRGVATEWAARRLGEGVPWWEAGEPAGQAGNGTAMRAAPVGLMCHDQPAELVRIACEQGRITHLDPRCDAGSVTIAGGVALALTMRPLDLSCFAAQLADWVRPLDALVASGFESLPMWAKSPPEAVVTDIAAFARPSGYCEVWPGISPFVVCSTLWSLYAFLRTPDDYWGALRTAIEVGGDVDSTAAMTGAMSGAHLGLEAVPDGLARLVNDNGTWGQDQLVGLAHRAHDAVVAA